MTSTWDVLGGSVARPAGCCCSTTTAATRHVGGGGPRPFGRRARGRDARALLRPRCRRPEPRAVRPGVARDRSQDHDQQPPGRGPPGEGELVVEIGSDYSGHRIERRVDHVVVEHGTSPLAELYFGLKECSSNRGAVDHGALIGGRPQALRTNPSGQFQLFRIGDAVAPEHPRRHLRRPPPGQRPLTTRGFQCTGGFPAPRLGRKPPGDVKPSGGVGVRCVRRRPPASG